MVHLCSAFFFLTQVHLLMCRIQGDIQRDIYIQCEESWFSFGGKCYKMFGEDTNRLNRHDASKRCNSYGGHLATVQSKEVQEFLFAFLLLNGDAGSWIGLNDIENETHFAWDDGTMYNYSNWNTLEPSNAESKDCVHMMSAVSSGEVGEWKINGCTLTAAYICQVDEGKQKGMSLDPTLCHSTIEGGWKFGDSCYNIVEETMTWEDAEKYCQSKYKGHLVKILNFNVNYFLTYIMSNFSTDIWIGIKMKDQFQQQFSSGWYVGHTYWRESSQISVDNTCVIRTKEKLWEVVSCVEKHPFICEVSTVGPPALKKASEGFRCPDDKEAWIDLGGKFCYILNNLEGVTFYHAEFECSRKGGSLVSLHSKAEIDGLSPFMKYPQYPFQFVKWRIFIGLYRPENRDNEFVWTDGSTMDYTYWGLNEPIMADGKCVYMSVKSKLWFVGDCEGKMGYLCSVRKISLHVVKTEEDSDCINRISFIISFGVTVSVLLLVNMLSLLACYFRPWNKKIQRIETAARIRN